MASAPADPPFPNYCMEHHEILEELEKSNNVGVFSLDISKAFNKVDHGILLNKLQRIGIN